MTPSTTPLFSVASVVGLGSVLKWFTSYLTNHYQSIKIGSSLSDVCKLLFGVPQGSVLGPLSFSLYKTPLSLIVGKHKGIKFHLYTDDSQVYNNLSHKNASATFEQLNRCLDNVKEWMSTGKLNLNPDKTEFIIFGSKKKQLRDKLKACFPINILGSPICLVDSVKNLEVWFDSDFSLFKHVQNVYQSCFVKLCDFRYVRQFVTHDASVLVANALVRITATHFSGASPSSIYVTYSTFKIAQSELYQTPGDAPE